MTGRRLLAIVAVVTAFAFAAGIALIAAAVALAVEPTEPPEDTVPSEISTLTDDELIHALADSMPPHYTAMCEELRWRLIRARLEPGYALLRIRQAIDNALSAAPSAPAETTLAALRTYGEHNIDCAHEQDPNNPCSCGFSAALASLAGGDQ